MEPIVHRLEGGGGGGGGSMNKKGFHLLKIINILRFTIRIICNHVITTMERV